MLSMLTESFNVSVAYLARGKGCSIDLCVAWIEAIKPDQRSLAIDTLTQLKRALLEQGYGFLRGNQQDGWSADGDGVASIYDFNGGSNSPGIYFHSDEFDLDLEAFGHDVRSVFRYPVEVHERHP